MLKLPSILVLILILISCGEQLQEPEEATAKILNLVPEKPYRNLELIINGNNFGLASESSFVLFQDSILLNSKQVIRWTNNSILTKLPNELNNGKLRLIINNDTTPEFNFDFHRFPEISTIEVKNGSYFRGSVAGNADEFPIKEIRISNDLLVGKYEITQVEYECIMAENLSQFRDLFLPISNVTFNNAVEFCNRLSNLQGLDTAYITDGTEFQFNHNSNGWRLPTEAEWEYLARANNTDDYYGNEKPDDIAWFAINSGYKPYFIGKKLPNQFGLYDMLGNVAEWCWDYYSETAYGSSIVENPQGPISGTERVVRGGSFQSEAKDVRVSVRASQQTDLTQSFIGFRIVRKK